MTGQVCEDTGAPRLGEGTRDGLVDFGLDLVADVAEIDWLVEGLGTSYAGECSFLPHDSLRL